MTAESDVSDSRWPAEAFSPGQFLEEEMEARGWSSLDVARRMGGDVAHDQLVVDTVIAIRKPGCIISPSLAGRLGQAFEVSAQFFLSLDRVWQAWAKKNAPPSTEGWSP